MKITINGSAKDFLAFMGNGNQSADAIAAAVVKVLDERSRSEVAQEPVKKADTTCPAELKSASEILDKLWYHTNNSGDVAIQMSIPHLMRTSWKHIQDCILANDIDWLLSGTVIPITLKNGNTLDLQVARDEDGKVYFIFRDCWPVRLDMSAERCENGWADTELREYANDEDAGIFARLPDELQKVIRPTKIQYKIDGDMVTCHDKLFCLSMTQVFGNGPWHENEPFDTWLDIFQDGNRSRVKNLDGSAVWWWLRSANGYYTFYSVINFGNYNYHGANYSGGVALGFCLEA